MVQSASGEGIGHTTFCVGTFSKRINSPALCVFLDILAFAISCVFKCRTCRFHFQSIILCVRHLVLICDPVLVIFTAELGLMKPTHFYFRPVR